MRRVDVISKGSVLFLGALILGMLAPVRMAFAQG